MRIKSAFIPISKKPRLKVRGGLVKNRFAERETKDAAFERVRGSMRSHGRDRRGFSLVETLVAIVIAVGFVFMIVSFQGNFKALQNFASQKLQSQQDVDQTVQIMTTAIRSAGPSSIGSYPIESAGTSSFVFYSDIDKDGLYERVRYFLGTSTVREGITKPAGSPLSYVTSTEVITSVVNDIIPSTSTPLFSYYNANYTGTQLPMSYPLDVSKICLVQFSFLADVNASTSPGPDFFSQMVDIRNLRSN
jgi:type II secretory pathway pseudopilin PulG